MNNLRTTQVQGKHGVIMKGATFGETAILFGNTSSSATLVASGTVVLCRLRDTIFHGMISKDVIKGLQERISEIRVVVDILSGV
jgi:CRP-like cAMP-binding protein